MSQKSLILRTARLVGPDGQLLGEAETHASSTNARTIQCWFRYQFRDVLVRYAGSHNLVFTTKVNGSVTVEGRLEAKQALVPRAPMAAKPPRPRHPKAAKDAVTPASTAVRKARREAYRQQAAAKATVSPKPTVVVAKAPGSKPRRKKATAPRNNAPTKKLSLVFWLISAKDGVPHHARILNAKPVKVPNTQNATIRNKLVVLARKKLGVSNGQLLGFELDSQRGIVHALVRTEPNEERGLNLRSFMATNHATQPSVEEYSRQIEIHASRALKRRKAKRSALVAKKNTATKVPAKAAAKPPTRTAQPYHRGDRRQPQIHTSAHA